MKLLVIFWQRKLLSLSLILQGMQEVIFAMKWDVWQCIIYVMRTVRKFYLQV